MHKVACPVCGQEEASTEALRLEDVAVFTCEEPTCQARVVFGRVMPRVVVEPYRDERGFLWTRVRFQDRKMREDLHVEDLDPKFAVQIARAVLDLNPR